jgi:glycosyltransferase involved in cell wall biosynthesis
MNPTKPRDLNYKERNYQLKDSKFKRCYNRDSQVIYPPVDIERFSVSSRRGDYYLILSAMVPYKRIDLAVQAFNQNGKRLVIAGGGPEYAHLSSTAKSNIEFILSPDDSMVERLYAGCRALIFPGEEDFGIVPLEAQASGKPVIAYGKGGALETVVGMGEPDAIPTGVFFRQQTAADLRAAIDRFEESEALFTPQNCRRNAERFNCSRFKSEMTAFIQNIIA